MRLLLDMHVFLWLASDGRKATKSLRAQVESATEVYVSAGSVWEVAIKHALGKIDGVALQDRGFSQFRHDRPPF